MAATLAAALFGAAAETTEGVSYGDDIRPILSDGCYACHGPDQGQRQAGLRLDLESGALDELPSGRRAVVRGDPSASALVERVASRDPARRMPPSYMGHDRLPGRDVELLRRWIEQGAPWEGHWAFQPPRRPEPPLAGEQRSRNPIDGFVARRLEQEGLTFSPPAGRRELARRAALDLTGLPAAREAARSFTQDPDPAAYERLLDGLLASPRYGEHMAGRWLDAARYADTNGYQTDGTRFMWRWRDWVITAFNSNMGFDQFTIEQLAGDMLPDATQDQIVASGFNRNHRTTAEGGSVPEEFRVEYVADRAETTATVWLGLTLGCARCHDHKFDPISQEDYYRFFAYFNNVEEKGMVWNFGNEDPLIRAPTRDQRRRLDDLERDAAEAERRWKSLDPTLAMEQREWEQSIRLTPGTDWHPVRDMAAHASFDGRLAVPSFTGGSLDGDPATEVHTQLGPGKFGKAATFDGSRYADLGPVGNYSYLDPVSVAAWIRPADASDGSIVASMGENPIGSGWGLFLRGGKLWWHMSQRWTDLSLRIETVRDIEPRRWQHVLLTYDGRRKAAGTRLYIDGRAQRVKVLVNNLDWPSKSNQNLKVGGGGGPENRFRGLIDEVRVWGRELRPDEARALAVAGDLAELAAIAPEDRTAGQRDKLRLAFLDLAASQTIRRAARARDEARRRYESYLREIPTVMVMREGPSRQAYVLDRGRYDLHGKPVSPGVPSWLRDGGSPPPTNRLELARWLASRSNPLTARVAVNRFWQMLFGVGLINTPNDFGAQGEVPVHRELLDWLAADFVDSGWDVKGLLKTIMLSATYRQSSRLRQELHERDPENRLLARGPRFRLPAAAIRDQALAASGLLQERVGGPSVRPYQPPGLWEEVSGTAYQADSGADLYRRSLYTYWKRTVAPPSMMNFDASDREICTVHVSRTNTPLQALNAMNDMLFVEAARQLAAQVLGETELTPGERVAAAFEHVLGRQPQPAEAEVLGRILDAYLSDFRADIDAAEELVAVGESPVDSLADASELAAYTSVASLVLNLDEAVTKQ